MMKPKLQAVPQFENGAIVLASENADYVLDVGSISHDLVVGALSRMDGTLTIDEVSQLSGLGPEAGESLVDSLDANHLLSDENELEVLSALSVLFDLEDLATTLLYESIYKNSFCTAITNRPTEVPAQVFYGMAIENYHFLFRESYFDAPALNYPASTKARLLMNEFYAEEYGHDELILKSLTTLGMSREQLASTIPLPDTMALCNALSFWARYDPIFFFSTLGVLEGKDLQIDSFVLACERRGLNEQFVGPIRTHSEINMKGEHGSLGRAIFRELPPLDVETLKRMRSQTRLFVKLYDNFYSGIWNHYSDTASRDRIISQQWQTIGGENALK
jgi:hypothetical protein